MVVFNSLPFRRNTCAEIPCPDGQVHIQDAEGKEVVSQIITDFETGKRMLIFQAEDLPETGYRIYRLVEGAGMSKIKPVSVKKNCLENEKVKITFNDRGEIISLFDKTAERECIDPEKGGNILQMFEDMPGTFDAWDIERHYEDTEFEMPPAAVEILEEGPLRSSLVIRRRFMNSEMKQQVVLRKDTSRIEFQTRID